MENKGKYYITTAIAYTSGKPHIGNSYEIVLADSIARFKRKEGYEVVFQTGTDEHGQKIELKAAEAGITPKEFVDDVAGTIKGLWDRCDPAGASLGDRYETSGQSGDRGCLCDFPPDGLHCGHRTGTGRCLAQF